MSDTILWQETISKDAPAATRRSKRQRGWDEQPSEKQSWYPSKVWRADRQKRGPQERRMRNRGDLASSPGGGGTRPAASSSYPNLVKVKAMPRPPGPRRHRRVHLAPSCLVAPAFFCFPFSTHRHGSAGHPGPRPHRAHTWEVDVAAQRVCSQHFQNVVTHRSDIRDDDVEEVAKEIERRDPQAYPLVGDRRAALSRLHGRHMAILVENVVMACHGDINYFSQRLQYNSADLGVVQRPRLWWCRVDWTKCTDRLHLPAQSRPPAPLSFAGTSSARSWSPVPRRGRVLPLRLPATRAALLRNPPARTSTAALVSGGLRPGAPLHRGIQEFAIGHIKEQAHVLPPDYTSAAPTLGPLVISIGFLATGGIEE